MTQDQATSTKQWHELSEIVEKAHQEMHSTEDLDKVVACIQEAHPAISEMSKKVEAAVKLGAELFDSNAALQSIQAMIKSLLATSNDLKEKTPEDTYNALVTLAESNLSKQ